MNQTYSILVDAMAYDHGKSGISVYTKHVVSALQKARHDVTVLLAPEDARAFAGSKVLTAPRWASNAVGSILYHAWLLPRLLKLDAYDFCLVAAANRRFPRKAPIPVLGTVHDLAQCSLRTKYDRWRNFYLNHILARWVRNSAARVIAISESTRQDILRHWHIPAERIGLVYNGLTLPKKEETGFLKRFDLEPGRYLLYVSRIEHPAKNHLRLIQAFEQLPRELTDRYKLVLVGAPWKDTEAVVNYAQRSPLCTRIRFTGFVPDEMLPEAYRNAALYVFPSLFEGFGLSLIEAMHYGCPCCCSNTSSLGEIGRDAALLFPPEEVDAIRNALLRLLENRDGIREHLVAAGALRATQFDWDRHAAEIVRLYEEACQEIQQEEAK